MSQTYELTRDGVCAAVTCIQTSGLVQRRLLGTDIVDGYCSDHDPLEDADVAEMWEEVVDVGQ